MNNTLNSMSFIDKMKKASKSVVDAGAKQMLKTDMLFLDREIKTRKQAFGVEIYDLMEELESAQGMSPDDKEAKIRACFDAARKDIAVVVAKKDCKKEEMAVLDTQAGAGGGGGIPPASGTVMTNSHPQDSEAEAM